MKISKALFAVIASSTIAGAAYSQEAVQAEKQAPIKKLLPDAYGSVEVRHSTVRKMEGDKLVDDNPTLSVRPTIGSTFFNGDLDTYFTLRYTKKADSIKIGKSITDNETFWKIVGNDTAALKAYAYTVMAGEDSFSDTALGLWGDAAKTLDITGGSLKLSAYTNPTGGYKSGKQSSSDKVSAADRTSLALTEDDTKLEQQDPTIVHYFGGAAKYTIAAVKGLSVGTGVDFGQQWAPKYAMQETDGAASPELDGYEYRAATLTKVNVGYKLTDATSVVAQLRGITNGFYEEGVNVSNPESVLGYGANRFEARVSLNSTLF